MRQKKQNQISLIEYGFIATTQWEYPFGSARVDQQTFDEIEKFVLDERNQANQIFSLSIKKWFGKVIKAQNYVGVVQTKNWTLIEVLPKISSLNDVNKIRKIFLKMLKTLKDSPFKNVNEASLNTMKFTILEIFIGFFLQELSKLIKKWIKKNYVLQNENLNYLKWKLKIKENISNNMIHKEKFVCKYDEFVENIKENKLIKSCLLFLKNISRSQANQKTIKEFLFVFWDIEPSDNIKEDLKVVDNLNRLHSYYLPVLRRVKIFLLWQSVVNFIGNTMTLALLFPMEKIFESYVAHKLKKARPDSNIKTQDRTYHLIEEHRNDKKFRLKPDIVIDEEIVADTKWKIIDQEKYKENYFISQSDMYQLFAYAKKYKSKKLYLIYPQSETFNKELDSFYYDYKDDNKIELKVIPYIFWEWNENDTCKLFENTP